MSEQDHYHLYRAATDGKTGAKVLRRLNFVGSTALSNGIRTRGVEKGYN